MAFDVLPGLRDIHLPDPVSWWPPAPGWWLLGIAVTAALSMLAVAWQRYLRSPRRAAFKTLERLKTDLQGTADSTSIAQALSGLLRRCALARFPRPEVAGLTGTAWLAFLDRTGGTNGFTKGAGRALQSAPYQIQPSIDEARLFILVEDWIRHAFSRAATSK